MTPTNLAIALALLGLLTGIAIGWDAGVHRHRAKRARLETTVTELEAQVADMNRALATDPNRASIDIGKTYILNQIQTLIDRLREVTR